MKMGFAHVDMGNSAYLDYIKGNHKFAPFNPERARTGTHYAIVDVFGGDRIPISLDFDYRKIDCDFIYIWFQGGCFDNTNLRKILKKMKNQTDAVITFNWEEAYWLNNLTSKGFMFGQLKSAKIADAVVSGFVDDNKRIKQLGLNIPNWRYLICPTDIEYLKYYYSSIKKVEPKIVYGMIHGRAQDCSRTLATMHDLHLVVPDMKYVLNRYRFVAKSLLEKAKKIFKMDWLEISDPIDPYSNFLKYLSGVYVFIDEYPAISQSRVAVESACIGTPVISHQYNYAVKVCFPELISDINLPKLPIWWTEKILRMIKDESYYIKIREQGLKNCEHYGFKSFYEQIEKIYKEFKK